VEGRGPLKSAARVRFLHSLPFLQPVRLAAKTPLSEGGYRKFESFTGYHFRPRSQIGLAPRYERGTSVNGGSSPLAGTILDRVAQCTARFPPKEKVAG
jgi:hypothetical protein